MKNFKTAGFSKIVFLGLLLLLLSGCGNRYEEQLRQAHQNTSNDISYLKSQIDSRQLTNALLIEKYAQSLIQQKPDYRDIVSLLKKESTSEGKSFKALEKRLASVKLVPSSQQQASQSLMELRLISTAADPLEYNNSLVDVVNTLASMSDGQLSVINVPSSQKASSQQSNALVGNPSYGQWSSGSGGRSFWEWYGMYSMFSNVLGGGRHYYDSWSSRPHYSYYNNYGRNRWGSNSDVSKNYNLSRKNPSRYNRASSATKQRYAKTASRSSSFGSSKSGYKSSGSSSSRYSSYGSSSRSSSFSSSRSSFSGK